MRLDKLTTKFQEALSDAQSLALTKDQAYIEPCHLLVALLRQEDGPRSLLVRSGVNIAALLKDSEEMISKLPEVHGQDQVQVGRDLVSLMQAAEKESLKKGDSIVTTGGVYGKISVETEKHYIIDIEEGKMKIDKTGVSMEMTQAAYPVAKD